jgi:methylglutaconyl-CoA hydratase
MSSNEPVLTEIDPRGVASLVLNRPEVHNAFDDVLIGRLTDALTALSENDDVRVVKVVGRGKSFSAGADLNWMRRMADYSREENLEDARKVAHMLHTLANFPRPTIAVVHGHAFGGGVGLIACCDIAVAGDNARFSLSEVRLGLIPATISPFVIEAIGARQARRLFLSAERFDANTAMRLGLVHEVSSADSLDDAVETFVAQLLENGPHAMAAAKRLVAAVAHRPIDENVLADVAERIALQRASEEGREGVAAFLDKRPPAWIRD